eukprot:CAMPEP_0202977858 /NCGR_PEP_ID=MMETSP1396-20130829/84494_1 /ASSEMBLY_ACC=CAM_ASM_000872 /TAXON_ID= /ORGANISM="Pseudokeronopsis sp., Strain Brazil" /LENGTH=86 /DNA_ID=CAMNT_0049716677 /DNA_START=1337 /DNA_END=1597 /DNA_ORIENTATION=+
MYGDKVGKVVAYKRTNWLKDPYSLTSYSHLRVGSKYTDCEDIRKPVWNKVFFAGEHTNCNLIGATNAAYLSGIKAAQEIVKLALEP